MINLKNYNILLVEDDAIIAISESVFLEREGFRIHHVFSGEEAIEYLKRNPDLIDLILMDIDLGKENMLGTEAAQVILKDCDRPLVFLSSHTEKELVEKTENITSYGYIVKNSGNTVLLASIKMALKLFDTNQKLQESEANLNLSQEVSGLGHWTWDLETNETTWSREMFRIFGIDLNHFDFNFKRIIDTQIHPNDLSLVKAIILKARFEKHIISIEFRILLPDKSIKTVFGRTGQKQKNNKGQITKIFGILQDITEKKKFEESLMKSKESLLTTIQSIGDGFIATDLNGNITIMNPVAEKLCGWKFEEAYLKPLEEVFQIFNAFSRKQILNPIKKVLRSRKIVGLANHTILISRDKTEYQIADTAAPIFNIDKKISGAVLIFSDVTEKYKTEEALSISEKRYRSLFNATLDTMIISNDDGYFIDANIAASKLFGYTHEEFLSLHALDITPNINHEMWQSMWKEFHKVGILNGEYEAKSKDGSKLYLAFQAVANFLPGMHLSVIRDITKTKEQDEQLLYHYELIESMDDAIIGTDLDFIITGWNRSAELMYGYKKEEVIGKSTGEILRANFQGMSLDDVRLEFSKEGKWVGEVIQKRKDGTDIFIQGSVSKLLDKNGLPKGAVSINRDISKLKKIEERLAKQESSILENQNRLAGMINSAMDGIISINKSHEIILINPSALKMFNYSANEILGQSINILIPKRFHNVHSNHIDEFGKTGVTTRTMNALGVVVGIRSNGNEFPVEASISQIEINKEKIYTIILRDLSEKKIIEDKIRENEKKLREAQRISKIGSWDWNLITNKVHWSDEMFNIFNIQKEDFDGSIETSINLFHPEDRERIKALTMKAVNEKKPQVFEARILLPDGQVRYVFGDGEMRFDELGILTYMAGTHQDITERKLAEIRIRNLLLEKEILLKEVHHRIKNNMQAIAGLLSIHSNSIENKEASEILLDAMNRINGMSILYDKLYRTTDFIEVSAKEYLSELVDKILEVNFSSKPIEIEKNIEEFNLNTKILFPLGIIINEVITNSLKYAFKSSNENKIRIETKENQNKIKIIIQDNGIGFKAKEKDSLHSGFGLKLIQILTAQLHGSYEFNTDNGTRFTLEFKLK